jgi:hypothetical protein
VPNDVLVADAVVAKSSIRTTKNVAVGVQSQRLISFKPFFVDGDLFDGKHV